MADLSEDIQDKVIFLLGYPAKTIVKESTHFNQIVLNRLQNLKQTTVDRVERLVELMFETREKLDATRDDANVGSIGEISVDPTLADFYIMKNYKRYRNELARTLDLPSQVSGTSIIW